MYKYTVHSTLLCTSTHNSNSAPHYTLQGRRPATPPSPTTMLLVQDRPYSHHQYHHHRHPPHPPSFIPPSSNPPPKNIIDNSLQLSSPQNINNHQQQSLLQYWLASPYPAPITTTQPQLPALFDTFDQDNNTTSNYDTVECAQPLDHLQIHDPPPFQLDKQQELMQSTHTNTSSGWSYNPSNGQLTPTSARVQNHHNNNYHHRESSLSSIGSTGPASPYNLSTAHPQIILPSDSVLGDAYYDALPSFEQAYNSSQKPLTHSQPLSHDAFQFGYNPGFHSSPTPVNFMAMHRSQLGEEDSMQPPDINHSSKLSVISAHESPAMVPVGENLDEHGVKNGRLSLQSHYSIESYLNLPEFRTAGTIPKLDRTMSDVYNDELYSPNFAFSSAPASQPASATSLPSHSDVFSQRLQAANSQHLSASTQEPTPDNARDKSPFRQGSPLAPTGGSFASPQVRLGSAQLMRERQKAEDDARALKRQIERSSTEGLNTPNTISPKDALLDYHETEEDASRPLFPPNSDEQTRVRPASQPDNKKFIESENDDNDYANTTSRRESSPEYSETSQSQSQSGSQSTRQGSGYAFAPPSVPGGVQVPQQYPFVPQQKRQASNVSAVSSTPDFPATLASMESSSSEYAPEIPEFQKKPAGAAADSGTYTCTYHGCTLRFETPTKLQKHKREGHRQSVPLNNSGIMGADRGGGRASGSDSPEGGSGMTSAAFLRNTQAGPHKCDRINPSTGKPCNTIFSRPYDLTRHEDTIHNARKQKVRCHLCTEEKTFSRNDALTRHMRVVHPEIDFPGKVRRRGHD